ncbi:hypothetical protein N5F23_02805 [Pseudomonas sichuanensis]|uniref:hypothetical protein n=1 Tax=Pseudomonas sichuanensis TaxID=2213015 RepID=UPI0024476A0A|nr:hypothetical protein [Pseudomonas sichuanensis]MDH0729547.1 hypothetical protein [Pseudomonas sichuanensis]MDH1581522.1 hypothetical protein [Pseudomonas sichuanensis]MDH1590884.1 hypothetical protein [Pseudomonas sichuanensis]MDH1595919.1 hypothetical protein [Pseudomonas sichuanensis]
MKANDQVGAGFGCLMQIYMDVLVLLKYLFGFLLCSLRQAYSAGEEVDATDLGFQLEILFSSGFKLDALQLGVLLKCTRWGRAHRLCTKIFVGAGLPRDDALTSP